MASSETAPASESMRIVSRKRRKSAEEAMAIDPASESRETRPQYPKLDASQAAVSAKATIRFFPTSLFTLGSSENGISSHTRTTASLHSPEGKLDENIHSNRRPSQTSNPTQRKNENGRNEGAKLKVIN